MTGPRSVIVNGGVDISKKPILIEGPHIFKVKGQYYLIAAEGVLRKTIPKSCSAARRR
jgi:alpha-N-arabinofuranosidase